MASNVEALGGGGVKKCFYCAPSGIANVDAAKSAQIVAATPGNGLANTLVRASGMLASDISNTNLPNLISSSRVLS